MIASSNGPWLACHSVSANVLNWDRITIFYESSLLWHTNWPSLPLLVLQRSSPAKPHQRNFTLPYPHSSTYLQSLSGRGIKLALLFFGCVTITFNASSPLAPPLLFPILCGNNNCIANSKLIIFLSSVMDGWMDGWPTEEEEVEAAAAAYLPI